MSLVGLKDAESYGFGLARFLQDRDVAVVEQDRPDRQMRPKMGKCDPADAVAAARTALSGTASVAANTAAR